MSVTIIIHDNAGWEIARFPADPRKSIAQTAESHGREIPVSCCAGACFVCHAKIVAGHEHCQIDKLSIPLLDLGPDDLLTCVGGVAESAFKSGEPTEITLQIPQIQKS